MSTHGEFVVLVTDELDCVYRELEMPLVPVLASIEQAGVRLDAEGYCFWFFGTLRITVFSNREGVP